MNAWTTIKAGDVLVKPGETVTQGSLGVDDEEWDQLVEARVVRNSAFPDMPEGFTGSPRDFVLEQRKKQLDDIEDNFNLDEIVAASAAEASPESVEPTVDESTPTTFDDGSSVIPENQ